MNERISQYLLHYVENPNPQYAVMLKGKWGCGKSFFVRNWLERYKELYCKEANSLEPIYVSLYGLKETSQITRCIDQVLHPFLYSKGVELTKRLLKIAGKIVLKTTLDLDKNGEQDISLDATIDSLSLLSSKDSEIKGPKLLIFDDLERCLINMKLLLGYINNFVEYGSCHVIIVGDETHITKKRKEILIEFKEKTVGREFEVNPDINAAINDFLTGDCRSHKWLQSQKELILDVFRATECDNLRILRQCLYDYHVLFSEVRPELLEKGSNAMQSLLASYIAVYCDYHSPYHDLFTQWRRKTELLRQDKKSRLRTLQKKYDKIVWKYNFDVLNDNHILEIVSDIETGSGIKDYVENILKQMQYEISLQERLTKFMDMSSEDFKKDCTTLINNVQKFKVPNMYIFGHSLAILAFFDEKCIYSISPETISAAKEYINDNYCTQKEKDELYKLRTAFYRGTNSFGKFHESNMGQAILEYEKNIFDTYGKKLMNKFEIALSNISDGNVGQLIDLSDKLTPDHKCPYNTTSVFKNIDANNLFNNIRNLSNASLHSLEGFFSYHYSFNTRLGSDCNIFAEDFNVLTELKSKLDVECERRQGLDKYVLHNFLKYLDGAIRRAKGETDAIEII